MENSRSLSLAVAPLALTGLSAKTLRGYRPASRQIQAAAGEKAVDKKDCQIFENTKNLTIDTLSFQNRSVLYRAMFEDGMTTIDLALKGYRLTTAEILYHLPDYPRLLQTFVLQKPDLAPRYPEIAKFLRYWEENIEAKIHSVKICSTGILTPAEFRHATQLATLH